MAELILYQKKSSLTLGISGSYFTKRMHMVRGCIVTLNKVFRSRSYRSTKNHFSFREHVYPSLTPIYSYFTQPEFIWLYNGLGLSFKIKGKVHRGFIQKIFDWSIIYFLVGPIWLILNPQGPCDQNVCRYLARNACQVSNRNLQNSFFKSIIIYTPLSPIWLILSIYRSFGIMVSSDIEPSQYI